MAALGAVTIRDAVRVTPTYLLVTNYEIVVGQYLGNLTIRNATITQTTYLPTVANYIVRQLSTIYRQLWPAWGQRFPQ